MSDAATELKPGHKCGDKVLYGRCLECGKGKSRPDVEGAQLHEPARLELDEDLAPPAPELPGGDGPDPGGDDAVTFNGDAPEPDGE